MAASVQRGSRSVLGGALACAMLLVMAVWPAAAHAAAPDPADFTLQWGAASAQAITDQLDKQLHKSGVQKLLANADRQATYGAGCDSDPFGSEMDPPPPERYCFDPADSNTSEWIPQGVTGVSDAQRDELWGDTAPLIVSWYDAENPGRYKPGCGTGGGGTTDACNEKGARVTFLGRNGKYRHVLLVWPYINSKGNASYDAVYANEKEKQAGIHAGGVVWYGNYLYVADTNNGLRVFDMRRIMDLNPDGDADTDDKQEGGLTSNVKNTRRIGRHDNVFYSFGYRYVMPQVGAWVLNKRGGEECADGEPNFSYTSIDRSDTPDTLIAGEYCNGKQGRVAKWPLDGDTGQLRYQRVGDDDIAYASEVYRLPETNLQGVTAFAGTWYLSQSSGCEAADPNGNLWRAKVSGGTMTKVGDSEAMAVGPQDLHY